MIITSKFIMFGFSQEKTLNEIEIKIWVHLLDFRRICGEYYYMFTYFVQIRSDQMDYLEYDRYFAHEIIENLPTEWAFFSKNSIRAL